MVQFRLRGIIPPNIACFTAAGDLDEEALRRHVEFLLPHIGGLYSCGTYGSGPLMSEDERKRALGIITSQVRGRVPVVAHVGTTNTRASLELVEHAQSAGAAAVALVPPFYYRHSDDAVLEHFRAVLQATSLPVYAYDNPRCAGYGISPRLLRHLADIGVRGIKDSSFSIGALMDKQRILAERPFDFVIGTESLFVPAYALGVRACVAGLANALPELTASMWQAALSGNAEQLREAQRRVLAARDIVHLGPTIPVVHAILDLRGIDAGYPRRPFLPVSGELRSKVRDALDELGLL
jgi:4-hydroxy-tetrahydrodipicolinate synthase